MFDARLRPVIDPPLNAIGRWLARIGVQADHITLAGVLTGLAAGAALGMGHYLAGLGFILFNRLLDGLDGAVARATRLTDFGGYFDIVGDFVFYAAVPLGFGYADQTAHLSAMLLLASFALTGTSFLAFAAIAAKRGLETNLHGRKSLFYNTGIAEGSETIVAFVLMALWPQHFVGIATVFAALCLLTVIQRTLVAKQVFSEFDNE